MSDEEKDDDRLSPKEWCVLAIAEVRAWLEKARQTVEKSADLDEEGRAAHLAQIAILTEEITSLADMIAVLPAERDWRTDLRVLAVARRLLSLIEKG